MFGPRPIQAFHINKQRKNDLLHFKRESFLTLAANDAVLLKFGFSEKATKFGKLCSVHATAYLSKSRQRFFKKNVNKSYYTNFTVMQCCHRDFPFRFFEKIINKTNFLKMINLYK